MFSISSLARILIHKHIAFIFEIIFYYVSAYLVVGYIFLWDEREGMIAQHLVPLFKTLLAYRPTVYHFVVFFHKEQLPSNNKLNKKTLKYF